VATIDRASVLVIEDDPHWQNMLRELLELKGFHVELAATVEQAREKVESDEGMRSALQIALVDLVLGKDTQRYAGLDILDLLQRHGIPTLIFTAYGTITAAHQALSNDVVTDFIHKTTSLEELVERIESVRRAIKLAKVRMLEEAINHSVERLNRYHRRLQARKDHETLLALSSPQRADLMVEIQELEDMFRQEQTILDEAERGLEALLALP
jgi:DNA-binding NtrC family response regulator